MADQVIQQQYIVLCSDYPNRKVHGKIITDSLYLVPKKNFGVEIIVPLDMKRMAYGGFKVIVDA